MEENKSGLATAGLVLGIIAICTSFLPLINNLSFGLALIGICFSIVCLIKKKSVKKSIVVVIICVLACVITLNSQKVLSDSFNEVSKDFDKMSGNSTEEVLKNDVDVTLGKFTAKEDKYGITDTKLTVKIKNKTNEKKSISVEIEAVDKDGNRIDTDTVYANDLGAGQSQSLDAFTLVSSKNIKKLKKATFKIIEASIY